jgi:hypothetical protein
MANTVTRNSKIVDQFGFTLSSLPLLRRAVSDRDMQFLAIFEVEELKLDRMRHFGIMVRDEAQLAEVREKITKKYKLKLIPGFRCDFRDPFGNRIQVVDLHDESLVWLLPYQEVQKAGIKFSG